MKWRSKVRVRRAVTSAIAVAMSMSMFTAIPVSADVGRRTYSYDGYSVDYNVTNEWDGAQTVELTVSNTGTESILNWALKYDAEGEITNLWNADMYEQNGDEYVIKNVGWNFEIAPSQSVTYGYTLNGSDISLPKKFEICSKRVDKTEGYGVQYNITKSWDTGVEGNIVITNTSNAPIEAWTLSFDSNFSVDNLWNGRVLENNGTSYTVAAEMWTNPVQPNSSITIGFVGSKAADVEAALSNFKLTEVVIGEGTPVTPVDPPEENIEITADAAYDKESGNINISWETNVDKGSFEIFMSEDMENFSSVGTVENVYDFVYTPEKDFETLYFKVVQTVDERSAVSNLAPVTSVDVEFDWDDEIDTDNDGITDVYENYFYATDPKNPDTDGDGIIDGYELYIGTSPLNTDSNGNGVLDGDEDSDGDGLSDLRECELGTDPLTTDTDRDGLSDSDEVNIHNTNPLKYDTDEDGISDGDEISLKLDPNNSSDRNSIVEQVLDSDNSVFDEINKDNDVYQLSVVINSAGSAAENLFVTESCYTNTTKNDSIVGKMAEMRYDDAFDVEGVKVCFDISEAFMNTNAYDAEFSGVDQYFIFKYFEDINMLLPIDTYHEGNTIYAEDSELGSYCVINLNTWMSLFQGNSSRSFKSRKAAANETAECAVTAIGGSNNEERCITFDQSELTDSDSGKSVQKSKAKAASTRLSSNARTYGNDIIFFPTPNDSLFELPEFILRNSKKLISEHKNPRIYIINYDGSLIKTESGKEYATKYSQVKKMVEKLDPKSVEYDYSAIRDTYYSIPTHSLNSIPNFDTEYDFVNYYGWLANVPFGYVDVCFFCNSTPNSSYVNNVKSYISANMSTFLNNTERTRLYIITCDGTLLTTADGKTHAESKDEMYQMLSKITTTSSGMNLNAINTTYFNICNESELEYFYVPTSGMQYYNIKGYFQEYCELAEKDTRVVYSMDDFSVVTLDDPITKDYLDAYNGLISENDKLDYADTDAEGYYDFEEIDFSLKKTNGEPMIGWEGEKVIYPTLADFINLKVSGNNDKSNFFESIRVFSTSVSVLPCKTNAIAEDADRDGIPDPYDNRPNETARVYIDGKYGSVYTIENHDRKGSSLHYQIGDESVSWRPYSSGDDQNWKVVLGEQKGDGIHRHKIFSKNAVVGDAHYENDNEVYNVRYDELLFESSDTSTSDSFKRTLDNVKGFLAIGSKGSLTYSNGDGDDWILSNVSNDKDERTYTLYNVNKGQLLGMKNGRYKLVSFPAKRDEAANSGYVEGTNIFWTFNDAFKIGIDFDRRFRQKIFTTNFGSSKNYEFYGQINWMAKVPDPNNIRFVCSFSDKNKFNTAMQSWNKLAGFKMKYDDEDTLVKGKVEVNIFFGDPDDKKYGETETSNSYVYVCHKLTCQCQNCKTKIYDGCDICKGLGCSLKEVDQIELYENNYKSVKNFFYGIEGNKVESSLDECEQFKVSDVVYKKDRPINMKITDLADYQSSTVAHEIGHLLGLCDRNDPSIPSHMTSKVSSIMNYEDAGYRIKELRYPQELDIYAVKYYYSNNYKLT